MTGLLGFSQELQTISNNVANLNTPGFKGSNSQFSDMFEQDNSVAGGTGNASGRGLQVLPSVVNFSAGATTQTGIATNLVDSGNSFFVLKDPKTGQMYYTQDGQFSFDAKGFLVDSTGNYRVQALTSSGTLQDLSQATYQNSAPKASSTITLQGNLNSAVATPQVVSGINVIDAAGGTHTLTATFTPGAQAGSYTVTVADGSTTVGTGTVVFTSGALTKGSFTFTYSPSGVPAIPLTLTLDPNNATNNAVTSGQPSTLSPLAVETVDGYAAGTISNTSFNASGVLQLTYTNGQTVSGPTVALANFSSPNELKQAGSNTFVTANSSNAQLGTAGASSAWGQLTPGAIEASNVDLATEFSAIITTQRGYQAASELESTANQMMQNALEMKGQGA
ncbi:MAG: flagellar hook-basal body complex protein [Burkholderiales bacterium]|nr:flagellar hook-basal body complex protein [Burkholderiales bacterium]